MVNACLILTITSCLIHMWCKIFILSEIGLFHRPFVLGQLVRRRYLEILYGQTATYPRQQIHGANTGPTWVLSAPNGPHVGPTNLAIRDLKCKPARAVSSDVLTLKYTGLALEEFTHCVLQTKTKLWHMAQWTVNNLKPDLIDYSLTDNSSGNAIWCGSATLPVWLCR